MQRKDINTHKMYIEEVLYHIDEDYRRLKSGKAQRYFYPANEKNNFKINQIFRELTKLKSPKKENFTL